MARRIQDSGQKMYKDAPASELDWDKVLPPRSGGAATPNRDIISLRAPAETPPADERPVETPEIDRPAEPGEKTERPAKPAEKEGEPAHQPASKEKPPAKEKSPPNSRARAFSAATRSWRARA
jgi:hypothetical protein